MEKLDFLISYYKLFYLLFVCNELIRFSQKLNAAKSVSFIPICRFYKRSQAGCPTTFFKKKNARHLLDLAVVFCNKNICDKIVHMIRRPPQKGRKCVR